MKRPLLAVAAEAVAPQNLDAEENVLGAMMLSPKAIDAVAEILSSGDFYRGSHGTIYGAAVDLHAKGEPVDAITLAAELERRGVLEEIGGRPRINELAALVPAASNAAHYARIVRDMAQRREQLAVGRELQQAAVEGGIAERRDLVDRVLRVVEQRELDGLDLSRLVRGGAIYDEPTSPLPIWGGDRELVIWPDGEGLMIVGPQGVGKTTLAEQLALARCGLLSEVAGMGVAPDPRPVLYVAADRPRQVLRSFARMVDEQQRQWLDERLFIWRGPLPFSLSGERQQRSLAQFARRIGVGTVFIDSLKDVAQELTKDEAGLRINSSFQELIADGIQLCVLHHQRKATTDGGKPKTLADVYGSIWLTAGMGSVVLLWGEPGDPIVEFRHLKQPVEEVGPLQLIHDHVRGETGQHDPADLEELIARATAGLTVQDAARHIFGLVGKKPAPNQVEKARRRLEALIGKGSIERRNDPDGTARYFAREKP